MCLTAHGQSINEAISQVLEDAVKCCTEGVVGVDPLGRRTRIYLDILSLMGDLPQAHSFKDMRGHSAVPFCPLCTMRRRRHGGVPDTNFSNDIHSSRMGYARFDARRRAIRALTRTQPFIDHSEFTAEKKD